MANPSDREIATRGIVEAAGAKMEAYYLKTGPSDFMIIATADDATSLLPGVMVAACQGVISNVRTIQAFSSAEFTAMQRKAAAIASKYRPPS